jgi:hypothetical protein
MNATTRGVETYEFHEYRTLSRRKHVYFCLAHSNSNQDHTLQDEETSEGKIKVLEMIHTS